MPKGSYGLSPNQRDNQRKPLEEILAEAESLPAPVQARTVDDMQGIVIKLRDEKGLSWTELSDWLNQHTEFNRSGTFWKNIYTGKRVGICRIEKVVTPTLPQPNIKQLE